VERASRDGTDPYNLLCRLAEAVPPGSDGLIMLPHLAGACCPEMLPQARGVYFGFTLGHGKGHFVRATMEAVAFMLRRNLDNLARMGTRVEELRSLGGASRSGLWNQIKADVCERPVSTLVNTEAACLGAAILAGTGAGVYTDIPEASRELARHSERFEPSGDARRALSSNYEKYCQLFDALKGLF
jgi:xylulokinase